MRRAAITAMAVVLAACGGSTTGPAAGTTPTAATPSPTPVVRITFHLAGDSTMGEPIPERDPETGWGENLQDLFDPGRLQVVNYSKRGRSTRTFLSEGYWSALLPNVRAGDWVIVQFGHNDGSIDEEQTPPSEYRANFTRFVADIRARGGLPLLATPIVVRRFDSRGALQDTHGQYPDIVRSVAQSTGTPLLDMQQISARLVTEYGVEGSRELYQHLAPGQHPNYPGGLADNIHLSPTGARLLAQRAAQTMKAMNLPLAAFLL